MENQGFKKYRSIIWLFVITLLFLSSCTKWIIPPELVGQWESEKQKVSVRTRPEKHNYVFTPGTAALTLIINDNKTASGTIGSAIFENAKIKKNRGNPDITGIEFIVKCGTIGKIFDDDPLENKEVQLWLTPVKDNQMEAELRYTEGWAYFPMAGFNMTKTEKSDQN